MRGVAVTSSVWSTAPMNIGSITALKSAAKVVLSTLAAGAAAGLCSDAPKPESSPPVVEEGRLPSDSRVVSPGSDAGAARPEAWSSSSLTPVMLRERAQACSAESAGSYILRDRPREFHHAHPSHSFQRRSPAGDWLRHLPGLRPVARFVRVRR